MGAFLEFLAGILGKEAVSQVRERVGKIWRRHKAKDMLVGRRAVPKVNFQDRVPEELGCLAKGSLPEDFNNLGYRAWLADPIAQRAFVNLFETSLTSDPVGTDASKTLENLYEKHTGETKKLAPGYINKTKDYLHGRFFGFEKESESTQNALLVAILRHGSNRDMEDIPSLREKAKVPAHALLDRGKTRWHYPDIVVPVRMELSETFRPSHDTLRPIGQKELLALTRSGTNLFLVGEAGAGKTTTLIDLCTQLINEKGAPLPVFLDAATWAASGKPLLDHIAGLPVLSSAGLTTTALARLNEAGQMLVILNGWNEISAADQAGSRERLQQFLGGATKVRLLVATRTANDSLGIPNPKLVMVRGFDWEQQILLIRLTIDETGAEGLISRLRIDRKLRAVTRNPFVLGGVLSLHKRGHVIPDSPHDLLEAVVDSYEREDGRAVALSRPPLRDFHRFYLEAIAQTMNMSASTLLSVADAHRVVHSVSQRLMAERRLAQPPEPTDLVNELCNQHLLHRVDDPTLRFAHQRFQEFFGACHVLHHLQSASSNESERTSFQRDVLNLPFWEDALELAATKLAGNPALTAQKMLLVELATPVDLAFAARLAGEMSFCSADGSAWQNLYDVLTALRGCPATEAQQYTLESMASTRSCEFAHLLWPLLESEEQQVRLMGYRLGGGLTVQQLGPDAPKRMNSWAEERRTESVGELADRLENLSFIENLAQGDSSVSVRAAAIQALYDWYLAGDAALTAWRSAPDEVKESKPALDTVLKMWRAEDGDLTTELVALARKSSKDDVKLQVGLSLLGQSEEIGLEAAQQALRTQPDRRDINDLVAFMKSADPGFLKDLAIDRVWNKYRVQNWVRKEIVALSKQQRKAFFDKAFEQMSTTEHEKFDASVMGSLASDIQIRSLVDEGLSLVVAMSSGKRLDEPTRLRYHAIERLLAYASAELLVSEVLGRAPSCTYDEAAWLAGILNRRAPPAEEGNDQETQWRPSTTELDMLIAILREKRETRDVPHCRLETDLASLASKTDPQRYLGFMLEIAGRYARAYYVYEEVLQRWIASSHRQPHQRPMNPPYGLQIANALQRCGFDAVQGLFAMASEPGAAHIVPGALVAIVAHPWIEHRGKRSSLEDSYVKEHRKRRDARRVLTQPNDTLQAPTDEVAKYLVSQINTMMVPGGALDGVDASKPSTQAHVYWETAKQLSRVPSAVGVSTLLEILQRVDCQVYPYLDIAGGIIRQGGMLPAKILPSVKSLWQREVATNWSDDQTPYRISEIATLHFFVEPIDAGIRQFEELLPELRKKVPLWQIVEAISPIQTKESLKVLVELLPGCASDETCVERIINGLGMNVTPEAAQVLTRLLADGTLSKIAPKSYRVEHTIAPKLGRSAVGNAEDLQQLLNVLEANNSPVEEHLVCAILAEIQEARATSLLFRYLDETKYPQGGMDAARVLEEKFVRREESAHGAGWIEVYPQACNAVRRYLFKLASENGPSQKWARAVLMNVEERRRSCGRPEDEPRHPDIETGTGWPHSIYMT